MPEFRTRPDGTRYPLTPKKGAAGVVLAGAVLTGVMTAAGGGTGVDSVGAGLDSATARSANGDRASSRDAKRKRNETWERMALRELKEDVQQRLQCAVQSHGRVREFFLRTPCESLSQGLFVLGDSHANTMVISVMWVRMSSEEDAKHLKDLEDTYGSGDITPIGSQILQLGDLRFTGRYYGSRQNGSLVVVAETEPLQGRPSASLLKNAAKIAAVLPSP